MEWSKDEVLARTRSCTVRIDQARGSGTGFFIAPRLIVTCAHVLFDEDRPIPSQIKTIGGSIDIDFRAVLRSTDDDVALIGIGGARDEYLPVDADLHIGDDVYAWGFSDDYSDGDSVTLEYEGPTRTERPLLKFKEGQIRPGMSGAPLVNMRTGRVCGMITRTRDRSTALGGRAIPAGVLYSLVPGVGVQSGAGYGWQQLASRLSLLNDEFRTRRVSGSTRLTLGDVLGRDGLLMPFWARRLGDPGQVAFDPVTSANDNKRVSRPWLVLAPPGAGKSTLAYTIFAQMARPFVNSQGDEVPVDVVPFLIDLRNYRESINSQEFGTLEWLRQRLDEVVGANKLFQWSRLGNGDMTGINANAFIILDSLDELLSGRPMSEITALLDRPMFRRADLVCCRTQFYERYLAATTSLSSFDAAELLLPGGASMDSYIEGYYKACFPEQWRDLAERFRIRLDSSPELVAVCRIPLRLNMALDLLAPGADALPLDPDLLGIYHAYLTGLLQGEAGKRGSVLAADQKLRLLEELAWHFYDEGNMGSMEAPPFTDMEFDRFIARRLPDRSLEERAEIAEDLRVRSVLHVDGSMFSSIHPGTMSFVHKSFQEYLIARWLYNTMSTSAETTAVALRQYMSPEVDEFLKEYLSRTRRMPRLMSEIARNCIEALRANERTNEAAEIGADEYARARLAREQLGYFLGNMNVLFASEFLREQLDREVDPWLRRGITIGLAIGGNERYLHSYVDRLRAEREASEPHVENQVNLGFHLSFCGDQPFEPLTPERDQGLEVCVRTIRRMVYQLGTEVDRGSWRLNLYTLLDLWQHRPVSHASARENLLELKGQLVRVLDKISNDDRCNWWPEIAEMRELIAELDRNGSG